MNGGRSKREERGGLLFKTGDEEWKSKRKAEKNRRKLEEWQEEKEKLDEWREQQELIERWSTL